MTAVSPDYSASVIGQSTRRINGQMRGIYKDCQLSSAYQPIYSLAHKRIVGYEALVRAENSQKQAIRPDHLFRPDGNIPDIVFLDRLCRHIHIDNFQSQHDDINWLFLNVSPQTTINGRDYGSFFGPVLEKFNFPSHRVVIEIVEYPISSEDNTHLIETVKYYKSLGCLIAIDDFGAGHSNFDRIWTLKPDIVKLDRSMLLKANDQKSIRQLLPGIVSLLHQAGALVIIEGVETESQTIIAMESDADMVQGYFFSKPHHDLDKLARISPPFKALFDSYKTSEAVRSKEFQHTYQRYNEPFQSAIDLLKTGHSLKESSKPLFQDDSVIRCYLLNPLGLQIGNTVTSQKYAETADRRFKPLEDARSADWFRRHYLRRAIMHPEQLQITRPYLSITGAHMCSTLSMMVDTDAEEIVLCSDLII